MNKRTVILTAGLACLIASPMSLAQNDKPAQVEGGSPADAIVIEEREAVATEEVKAIGVEEREAVSVEETGLRVEERRYQDRLEGVTVEHSDRGVTDYYDFNDPAQQRQEGGIAERDAMRTWRLGGGKK